MNEFKKRLREHKLDGFTEICTHNLGECDCSIKWILKIIEQAKEEFPTKRLHITPQYVRKMEEWFQRWFGE